MCYNRGQGEVFGWPFSHCPWRNRDLGYREGWINKMHRESRQDTSVWRNRPGVNVAISVLESFPIPHSPLPGGLSRLLTLVSINYTCIILKTSPFWHTHNLNRIPLFATKWSLTRRKKKEKRKKNFRNTKHKTKQKPSCSINLYFESQLETSFHCSVS